jgi:hypothetical protein
LAVGLGKIKGVGDLKEAAELSCLGVCVLLWLLYTGEGKGWIKVGSARLEIVGDFMWPALENIFFDPFFLFENSFEVIILALIGGNHGSSVTQDEIVSEDAGDCKPFLVVL